MRADEAQAGHAETLHTRTCTMQKPGGRASSTTTRTTVLFPPPHEMLAHRLAAATHITSVREEAGVVQVEPRPRLVQLLRDLARLPPRAAEDGLSLEQRDMPH